ncbi:MAG TPA: PP2C family protein-serine/threonine phosphatase, partial [Bacteroidota bacterium]|nr:PP2C family protein-serine/threonine phosphatase [Bacteroidota bacterium]
QGDLFVFYTDGIIEAMNKDNEEYGEERFIKIINENSNNSSKEIIKNILQDVKKFIGKASQHDDITLLVIKIF